MSNDKSGDDASATSREALVDKSNVPVMPSNRRSKPRSSAGTRPETREYDPEFADSCTTHSGNHGEQESTVGVESEASWSDGEDTVQDLSEGPDANINEDGFNGSMSTEEADPEWAIMVEEWLDSEEVYELLCEFDYE
ncbi:hypothetical protein B0H10DRAFT_2226899 [Mycena sp. CBHHK59/15]|nr:hypothetical protein B0H10DRAFT_1962765 [Mycena sp. CBHHK59/15]KAJ6608394.1 hypothetical protein B0H10DRAFT_2226899 [Mycena sp. CBHHK59/15]